MNDKLWYKPNPALLALLSTSGPIRLSDFSRRPREDLVVINGTPPPSEFKDLIIIDEYTFGGRSSGRTAALRRMVELGLAKESIIRRAEETSLPVLEIKAMGEAAKFDFIDVGPKCRGKHHRRQKGAFGKPKRFSS